MGKKIFVNLFYGDPFLVEENWSGIDLGVLGGGPMKTLVRFSLAVAVSLVTLPSVSAQTCCEEGVPVKWKADDKGVRWYRSLEEAKKVAAKNGRLIMLHQLVGDMDREGC